MKDETRFLADILELDKAAGKPAADDPETVSLAEMDGKYARLRPDNQGVTRLHVVDRRGNVRSFQYVHLDSDGEFGHDENGQFFVVRFTWGTGSQRMEVTVRGRNLWRMYDYIQLHRWPYLRVADRDFAGDKEPVVTSIDMQPLKEESNAR